MRRSVSAFAAVLLALPLAAAAQTPAYPARTVTILITTPPGGSLDPIARVLATQMEKKWGQSVVVESRPGGGGNVAGTLLARSAPDGHTLMIGGSPTVTSLFVKDMPYDAFKDVTPVSLLGLLAYQLQVSRGLKVRNLKEFVDYAKANPGKINMGTVALGTHELEMLGILDVLGVKAALVPYKGIAPIWLGLISNELDATISASIPPQQRTGEIIAIAVGGERRNPSFNETMTFREQGYTLDPYASYTLWARAATPRTLLATIAAEAGAAAKSDDWVNRITRTLFIEGVGSNLEGAEKFVREEYARLKAIADRAGLKPQ